MNHLNTRHLGARGLLTLALCAALAGGTAALAAPAPAAERGATQQTQTVRKFQDPVCARYRVVLHQPHHNCLAPFTKSTSKTCVSCRSYGDPVPGLVSASGRSLRSAVERARQGLQHSVWRVTVQTKWGSAVWPDIWFDGTQDIEAWYDGSDIWVTTPRYGHRGHHWCDKDHSALVSVRAYRCTATSQYREVQNPYPPYNCIRQRGTQLWGFWDVDARFAGHLVSRTHYQWVLIWPGGTVWTGLDRQYGGGTHECKAA